MAQVKDWSQPPSTQAEMEERRRKAMEVVQGRMALAKKIADFQAQQQAQSQQPDQGTMQQPGVSNEGGAFGRGARQMYDQASAFSDSALGGRRRASLFSDTKRIGNDDFNYDPNSWF